LGRYSPTWARAAGAGPGGGPLPPISVGRRAHGLCLIHVQRERGGVRAGAHATGSDGVVQAHYGVERACAPAGLVQPCSHPRDRCAEHFPRPWGLAGWPAPLGQVHLSGTSVSALAFTPLLRGLCRQKGAVLPTGGHRRTARAVTKEAPRPPWGSLLQRYACIRAGEHSKPHPRPMPQAGPTSPSCPTAHHYTTFS